ncbi:right-handed parallel beta-helix repeat-containing protein [Pedobacter rhizosphaerae]|uniref:Right handed beta helix domain-containing protein n=1 Tax=Pedobacter rhizosphaerae TaxID=390241 RepID=A0A1H9U506_9SPHI|nr:hypothetical protein [Pedobacter rhizosphaerae]SES04402.1 hypothetical protein SAMN04488023_12743 [Pedobacter rhizosphaerae]
MRAVANYLILFLLMASACRKGERVTADPTAKLKFNQDSIVFDTVFTSTGSATKRLKVLNPYHDALNITEIKLAGGNTSPFSLNINGQSLNTRNNVILNGQDSLNILVKVLIDPDARKLPFLVQDSIVLTTNGNKQVIQLLAYGQNAVFINTAAITANTIWTKALPYVINHSVTVGNGATLTIEAGTRILFHKDATLYVDGTLLAEGKVTEPIEFSSDRLEIPYSDLAGQWKGLYFRRTGNGVINYARIKNASIGITADSLSTTANPKLILANSIVKNMQVAAFIGYHSELTALNNLVYNCGNYLIYAVGGGKYNLKQNTFAGYNLSFPRKTAALTFSDYFSAKSYNGLQLNLTNNIIWGNLSNELDIQHKTSAPVQSTLLNNLIKTTISDYSTNNLVNADPLFIAAILENFGLSGTSPAIKKGANLSSDPYYNTYLNKDLKGKTRIFPSYLGCYENF